MIRVMIGVGLFGCCLGQENNNSVLPRPYPVTRYEVVWKDSPFLREVVRTSPAPLLGSFGQTMVLEGMVDDAERGAIAYIRDEKEKRTYVVTTEVSTSHGFRIVVAKMDRDPRGSSVTITDGEERADISYRNDVLTSSISRTLVKSASPQPQQIPPKLENNITGAPVSNNPEQISPVDERVARRRVIAPSKRGSDK